MKLRRTIVIAALVASSGTVAARQPRRGPATVMIRQVTVKAGADPTALVRTSWLPEANKCAVSPNLDEEPHQLLVKVTTDGAGSVSSYEQKSYNVYQKCFEKTLRAVTWPVSGSYAIRVLVGAPDKVKNWARPVSVTISGTGGTQRIREDAAACYRKFVAIDDFSKGTVVVTLTIEKGKATSSTASGFQSKVAACIRGMATRWVPDGAPDGALGISVDLEGK